MKKSTKSKLLAALLITALLVQFLPITSMPVYASVSALKPLGEGTPQAPFLISSPGNLIWMSGGRIFKGQHFVQTQNIDMAGIAGFTPINGDIGIFDGNGYKISNLRIVGDASSAGYYIGLFDELTGKVLRVTLENIDIEGRYGSGGSSPSGFAGSIAAYVDTDGIIEYCSIIGASTIRRMGWGPSYLGGVTGFNSGKVRYCTVEGTILRSNDNPASLGLYSYVGGITGANNGEISDCINTAEIQVTGGGANRIGGIAADSGGGPSSTIENTLNLGNITGAGTSGASTGGIIGYSSSNGSKSNNFFLNTTATNGIGSDRSVPLDGPSNIDSTPLTSAQINDVNNFTGWDFVNTWSMSLTNPYLKPLAPGLADITLAPGDLPGEVKIIIGDSISANKVDLKFFSTDVYVREADDKPLASDVIDYVSGTSINFDRITYKSIGIFVVDSSDKVVAYRQVIPTIRSSMAGEGTLASPFIVTDSTDLANVSINSGSHYRLDADIDLSGVVFIPIGDENGLFLGTFDGYNHKISNLSMTSGSHLSLALFGILSYGKISNLTVENVSINNTLNDWDASAAAFAAGGFSGEIISCHITGTSSIISYALSGGIAAYFSGSIERCSSSANIFVNPASNQWSNIGGIAGYARSIHIRDCYNTGNIIGNGRSEGAGGIAGAVGSGVSITNVYNLGDISVPSGESANGGSILGANWGWPVDDLALTNTFYKEGTASQGIGYLDDLTKLGHTTAKSLAQLKNASTFTGWNFTPATGVWSINSTINDGFPVLQDAPQSPRYRIIYDGNGGTGGSVPVDYEYYRPGMTVLVLDNPNNLTKTGFTFGGWNTQSDGNGTTYNGSSTFNIESGNVTLYAKWTAAVVVDNSSEYIDYPSTTPSTTPSPMPAPTPTPAVEPLPVPEARILINGKSLTAGKEIIKQEAGRTSVDIVIQSEAINQLINEAIAQQTSQADSSSNKPKNTIAIVASSSDAAKFTTILTGDIVKELENNDFKLSVQTKDVNYNIPAKEIGIDTVAELLGVSRENLVEITVDIIISQANEKSISRIAEKASSQNMKVLVTPTSFSVNARIVTAEGKREEVAISTFNQYVERVIEIPAEINPESITTGIVLNLDGTFSHIPTDVFQHDNKWYARLNSLTNSIYTVIWNPITVASVKNHWSEEIVNDMASRLVIKNPDTFDPDGFITRGEFAEYITKALGIFRTGVEKTKKFSDVRATHRLAAAITIASQYGIIDGYPDGTFKPNALISRQEAMTMYARAMDIAGLNELDSNKLESYEDKEAIDSWAYLYVKKTVSAGVFNGRTPNTIDPQATFTYAEAATAVRNLLIAAGLINN